MAVQITLSSLSDDPTSGNKEEFQSRLGGIMAKMEQRIQIVLDKSVDGQISVQDGENFYRLLGAYRSISAALITFASNTSPIDWSPWREERFA